ncbi:hypothetical protein B6U99_06960, partial [Candidatus Geothermarchaeota archaeon ex4572_27]
ERALEEAEEAGIEVGELREKLEGFKEEFKEAMSRGDVERAKELLEEIREIRREFLEELSGKLSSLTNRTRAHEILGKLAELVGRRTKPPALPTP